MTDAEKRAELSLRQLKLQTEKDDVVRTAANHVADIDARLRVVANQLAVHYALEEYAQNADLDPVDYVSRLKRKEAE